MTFAYMRVSTKRQADRASIETQREEIQKYADRNGKMPIDEWLADDGKSSRIPLEKRAGGVRMFEAARAGKLKKLIVYMYDRLGRDEDDGFSAKRPGSR